MLCVKKEAIGWIGSAYFAGWASSCLIIPLLADKIGRKWIVVMCLSAQIGVIIGILLSKSVGLTTAMMAIGGFLSSGRISIAYVYMTEFVPVEWILLVSTIYNCNDALISFNLTLYFDYIDPHARPV